MFQQSLAAIISGLNVLWFPLDVRIRLYASGPSKSKNSNYWKIVVSGFIERTVLLAGIHLYRDINSKNINCFIGYCFYMYYMVYNMAARMYDFFAKLGHFQGIIICLFDNKRQ